MRPLTSTGGPTAAPLKKLTEALAASSPLTSAAATSAFTATLERAVSDPNLIDEPSAATLASSIRALLCSWPPERQFGVLYLSRLLAANSDAARLAMIRHRLHSVLLSHDGALGPAAASAPAARGAKLMALALLSNLASHPRAARAPRAHAPS